ncbi:hypothetical protein P3T76_007469 [Phytophthora citrophthora]|uniref:Uncharacterized protein n=1 Tax=Phytophthora citrophthora TaxID=4793 RepID=A0AAD9LL50_9STRA|nr:hypothetical protein P3T76_007469 [Phytophthora citrophthora]
MNGGTYNALLNTTSKRTAAVAARLSILSYVAMGVVTATSGVHYLNTQVDIPVVLNIIALLFSFALLAIVGIPENSRVAIAILCYCSVVRTSGLFMVVVVIFANLLGDPSVLMYFALYFIVVALVMFVMFERVTMLRCILALMKKTAPSQYAKETAAEYFRTQKTHPRWNTLELAEVGRSLEPLRVSAALRSSSSANDRTSPSSTK